MLIVSSQNTGNGNIRQKGITIGCHGIFAEIDYTR